MNENNTASIKVKNKGIITSRVTISYSRVTGRDEIKDSGSIKNEMTMEFILPEDAFNITVKIEYATLNGYVVLMQQSYLAPIDKCFMVLGDMCNPMCKEITRCCCCNNFNNNCGFCMGINAQIPCRNCCAPNVFNMACC